MVTSTRWSILPLIKFYFSSFSSFVLPFLCSSFPFPNNNQNGDSMTIEEIDKIISDLRQQIPNMQAQLNQAEGYKQALMDMEKEKKEPEKKDK